MNPLLTDKEIDKLADEQRKADGLPSGAWLDSIEPKRIVQAQAKKLVEWLQERTYGFGEGDGVMVYKTLYEGNEFQKLEEAVGL